MAAVDLRGRWLPGQSGNPAGRTKLPEHLRSIKALTQEEACRLVSKYARMHLPEIDAILEARSAPMLDLAIAAIFKVAFEKGDFQRLGFLLDRAIGKIQVLPPTDAETAALQEIRDLSDQELVRLVKEKLPELDKPGG